jgi:hypothetical protein
MDMRLTKKPSKHLSKKNENVVLPEEKRPHYSTFRVLVVFLLLILLGAFLAFSSFRCWFGRADANTARPAGNWTRPRFSGEMQTL